MAFSLGGTNVKAKATPLPGTSRGLGGIRSPLCCRGEDAPGAGSAPVLRARGLGGSRTCTAGSCSPLPQPEIKQQRTNSWGREQLCGLSTLRHYGAERGSAGRSLLVLYRGTTFARGMLPEPPGVQCHGALFCSQEKLRNLWVSFGTAPRRATATAS